MDERVSVVLRRAGARHLVVDCAAKLRMRGALPGASVWDRAAHVLRQLQNQGASAEALLPLALPASWLVNAEATSVAMRRWLAAPAHDAWRALLEVLGPSMSLDDWSALEPAGKAHAQAALDRVADGKDGADRTATSKVLALLRPQLVPLMDDAALRFAGCDGFVELMDWFAGAVRENETALIALARAHELAVLDAPQVLDRLVWFESAGFRLALGGPTRFYLVRAGGDEAIVRLAAPHLESPRDAAIALDDDAIDAEWRGRARAAFEEATSRPSA